MGSKKARRSTVTRRSGRPHARRTAKKRTTKVVAGDAARTSGLWDRARETAEPDQTDRAGGIRLNLFMARCGVASRRGSDELIQQGRVTVNGEIVTRLGDKIDPVRDRVVVDGEALKPEKPVYVLLHKPKAVVCTNAPGEQKVRAIDLVDRVKGRLFTVGRLDVDSEGLVILTNDGVFAERLMHPRFGVPKVYDVTIRGRIEPTSLAKARGGVWLCEGRTRTARIRVKRRSRERSYLEVSIREGRNREVRRVFARLGYPVLKLKRVRIGHLTLRGVGRGKYRFLTKKEVEALLEASREA